MWPLSITAFFHTQSAMVSIQSTWFISGWWDPLPYVSTACQGPLSPFLSFTILNLHAFLTSPTPTDPAHSNTNCNPFQSTNSMLWPVFSVSSCVVVEPRVSTVKQLICLLLFFKDKTTTTNRLHSRMFAVFLHHLFTREKRQPWFFFSAFRLTSLKLGKRMTTSILKATRVAYQASILNSKRS